MKPLRTLSFLTGCAILASSAQATDLSVLRQNYVDQQYGLFLHYSMGTYTQEEWAHSGVPINNFNPGGLVNTDQWASTAAAAGMKYGVLTTKHHDGFALWNTNQSAYDVAGTSWYSTHQQDIVGSYVNSFRNAGLGVGLYYSVWDKFNGIGPRNYGDDVGLPAKSSAVATAYVKAELNHLLTNYGHIDVLWTDGWGWNNTSNGAPYSLVNYNELYNYVKTVSPDTLLLNNVNEGNLNHTDIVGYELQYSGQVPPANNTTPSEASATLRSDNHWFWTGPTTDYKASGTIGGQILTLNDRNSSYLLDVPPDQSGVIPQSSVNRLQQVKAYVDSYHPGNLAEGKTATESSNWGNSFPAANGVDHDFTNFSHTATEDTNPWWKVNLGELTEIGEIVLYNRPGYAGRLRDLTIQILAPDGISVLYSSSLINPGNSLGGGLNDYTNGPDFLALRLDDNVLGQFVRISRTVETSGVGNLDDRRTLTMAEVAIYSVPEPGTGVLFLFAAATSLFRRKR